jgi:hypothetical protein
MKAAIMQPYLFPYLGYFQRAAAVDAFVFHDDDNYKKGGWVNRNRILVNEKARYFTLCIVKASSNKLIKDLEIVADPANRNRITNIIRSYYSKAPMLKEIMPMLEGLINNPEKNLSDYIESAFRCLCGYLGIKAAFLRSSELKKDPALKGQDKVIDILKKVGATEYINPIGGSALYSKDVFKKNAIELNFIKMREIKYAQFDGKFVPDLSIVDVLMFNPKDAVKNMLNSYEII